MNIDDFASDAVNELHQAASEADPPDIEAAAKSRRRSRVAAGGFIGALVAIVAVATLVNFRPANSNLVADTTTTTTAQTSTTTTTTTMEPTSTTTTTPAMTTTVPAAPPEWSVIGTEQFAAVFDDRVEIVTQERTTVLDIADVSAATLAGDELVFTVNELPGVWLWPPLPSDADPHTFGNQQASQLIAAQPSRSIRLMAVSKLNNRPVVMYVETDVTTDFYTERLIVYDIDTRESKPLFDLATRRPGLHEEEQSAFIGHVASNDDTIAVTFGVGDGIWVEWFSHDGMPLQPWFTDINELATVVELALAPDRNLMAVTVEAELHHPITEIYLVDDTGDILGHWSTADKEGSLFGLNFDGRYITASLVDEFVLSLADAPVSNIVVIDTTDETMQLLPVPGTLALQSSSP